MNIYDHIYKSGRYVLRVIQSVENIHQLKVANQIFNNFVSQSKSLIELEWSNRWWKFGYQSRDEVAAIQLANEFIDECREIAQMIHDSFTESDQKPFKATHIKGFMK